MSISSNLYLTSIKKVANDNLEFVSFIFDFVSLKLSSCILFVTIESEELVEQRSKREVDAPNAHNIFISPSSIFQSLMLAYFGAAGETETELANAMGFSSVERDLIKKSYVFERAFQVRRFWSYHKTII